MQNAKRKNCNYNFGDWRPPITPPLLQINRTQKNVINARREFIVHSSVCRHSAKEVCGSSVMPVDSCVLDKTTMLWLLVFRPHRQRSLRLVRDAVCWFSGGSTSPTKSAKL
ncbi:hypothetical protein TNCV_481901 [Trichonephila clavipes]|nr:hypothetical protein TNCV_481901 [Trichonephila clavipes]